MDNECFYKYDWENDCEIIYKNVFIKQKVVLFQHYKINNSHWFNIKSWYDKLNILEAVLHFL